MLSPYDKGLLIPERASRKACLRKVIGAPWSGTCSVSVAGQKALLLLKK